MFHELRYQESLGAPCAFEILNRKQNQGFGSSMYKRFEKRTGDEVMTSEVDTLLESTCDGADADSKIWNILINVVDYEVKKWF